MNLFLIQIGKISFKFHPPLCSERLTFWLSVCWDPFPFPGYLLPRIHDNPVILSCIEAAVNVVTQTLKNFILIFKLTEIETYQIKWLYCQAQVEVEVEVQGQDPGLPQVRSSRSFSKLKFSQQPTNHSPPQNLWHLNYGIYQSNHWFCVTMTHTVQLPQVRHLSGLTQKVSPEVWSCLYQVFVICIRMEIFCTFFDIFPQTTI